MVNCNTCKTRHCNGCSLSSKKVEIKTKVLPKDHSSSYWKDVLLGIRQHEELRPNSFTFDFVDSNEKLIDNRIFLTREKMPCFYKYKYSAEDMSYSGRIPDPTIERECFEFNRFNTYFDIPFEDLKFFENGLKRRLAKEFFCRLSNQLEEKQDTFPIKPESCIGEIEYRYETRDIRIHMSVEVGLKI